MDQYTNSGLSLLFILSITKIPLYPHHISALLTINIVPFSKKPSCVPSISFANELPPPGSNAYLCGRQSLERKRICKHLAKKKMRSKLSCRISLMAAGSTSIIYCLLLSVNHLSSVVRGRRISAQSRKRRCVGTVTSRARRRNSWFLMVRHICLLSITKQPCSMNRFWRQI